jgi:hypothetical protein
MTSRRHPDWSEILLPASGDLADIPHEFQGELFSLDMQRKVRGVFVIVLEAQNRQTNSEVEAWL